MNNAQGLMSTRTSLWKIVLIAWLSALLLTGCTFNGNDDEVVILTGDDNGTEVEVNQGDRIQIQLESNPTTGYEWAVDSTDETILVYEGSTYEAEDGNRVGQGGIQTFTFQAAEPGTAEVHLKYWRSWEGDASIVERFDVALVVSAN